MKLLILSILSMVSISSWAQELIHNESTITVQNGAVLYVEGTMLNTATGVIANSGTIELKGDFTNGNPSGWNSPNPNTLKFSGGVNSTVTSNTANFYDVVVQKDAGFTVNLADNMNVTHNLDFNSATSGRLVTGNFDVKLTSAATVTGVDADEYVATTGTGGLSKTVSANATFLFPVGDLTNYTPLSSNYSGSGYTTASLRTRVNNVVHPNKPADASDFIARYWDVDQTGIAGYSNTMTGTYVAGDITGTASLVKGAVYNGSSWSFVGAANAGSTVTGITTAANSDFTGINFFGKVDLKVFLAGAMPGSGNPPMDTKLSTPTQLIPSSSPYSVAPWNAPVVTGATVPASTVDWILVETRDPSINIVTQTSAFLKNDGTIIGSDGGPLRLKDAPTSAIISIRHRNHLGIRTKVPLDLAALVTTSHDFSTDTSKAWTNNSILTNGNMRPMGTGPTYCLWAGNANLSGSGLTKISYIGLNNDPQAILNAMPGGSGVSVPNTYDKADVNLNRTISFIGLSNDPATVLQNMPNSGSSTTQHLP